jgi:hypothetical protein
MSKLNSLMLYPTTNSVFYTTPVTISYASNVEPDLSTGNFFKMTLTGNCTIDNPTILGSGFYYFYVTVDGSGGHSLSFDTAWKKISGSYLNSAGAVNIITFMTFTGQSSIQYFINQRS